MLELDLYNVFRYMNKQLIALVSSFDPAICLDVKNTFKVYLSEDKTTFSLKVL